MTTRDREKDTDGSAGHRNFTWYGTLSDPSLQSTPQILAPVAVQLGVKSGSWVASETFLVFSSGLLSNSSAFIGKIRTLSTNPTSSTLASLFTPSTVLGLQILHPMSPRSATPLEWLHQQQRCQPSWVQ